MKSLDITWVPETLAKVPLTIEPCRRAEFGSVAMEQSGVANPGYLPGKLIVIFGRGELRAQVTMVE